MELDSDGMRVHEAWSGGPGKEMPILNPETTIDLLAIVSYAIWQIDKMDHLNHWNSWLRWIGDNPHRVTD